MAAPPIYQGAGDVGGLVEFLRSSDAYDIIDDAVLGVLHDSTVVDVLADFGFPINSETRRLFAFELDAAIVAGEA